MDFPFYCDPANPVVFFIDVDNTLINNDQVKIDINKKMLDLLGEDGTSHFWDVYEQVRKDMDGVDIPATLKRLEPEFSDHAFYRKLYRTWVDFPYTDYIYPGVFEMITYLKTFALPTILSDGDASFQLRKVVKSGICHAVDGNVLIYQHKDHHFEDIADTYDACHYVMIEDKPTLLAAAKAFFGEQLTTVLVKQGKYANVPTTFQPDYVLPSIGDVRSLSAADFGITRGVGVAR